MGNTNNLNVESKPSTVTSSAAFQVLSTSSCKSPMNGFFSSMLSELYLFFYIHFKLYLYVYLDKTNGLTKPLNGLTKSLNNINIVKKDKKSQICEKWDSNSKL